MSPRQPSAARNVTACVHGRAGHMCAGTVGAVRILHVGDDYAALRPCGLTYYSDALMRAQAAAGHEVAYAFSGRYYPRIGGPRLKRWRSGAIRMYELVGSPNRRHWWLGTRTPELDLDDAAGERVFDVALRETRPDVVHVQELARLPSSVIEHAKEAGVPVVMTLHDYKPLCSTVRLVHADGRFCMQREVGEDCACNCASAPADAGHLSDLTLEYELERAKHAIPFAPQLDYSALAPVIVPAMARLRSFGRRNAGAASTPAARGPRPGPPAPPSEYQRRRDVNLGRLNS